MVVLRVSRWKGGGCYRKDLPFSSRLGVSYPTSDGGTKVLLAERAVVVPTKSLDFFENINTREVIEELSNELGIEVKLKVVSRKFISEIEKDICGDRVDVGS
jgi:hypothetical protein